MSCRGTVLYRLVDVQQASTVIEGAIKEAVRTVIETNDLTAYFGPFKFYGPKVTKSEYNTSPCIARISGPNVLPDRSPRSDDIYNPYPIYTHSMNSCSLNSLNGKVVCTCLHSEQLEPLTLMLSNLQCKPLINQYCRKFGGSLCIGRVAPLPRPCLYAA